VLTGVDRPGLGGLELEFFGQRCVMPIGHARLAVKTQSPMMVGFTHRLREGVYTTMVLGMLEPPARRDDEGVRILAQKVLELFEAPLRKWVDEWLMFYPLWPAIIPGEAVKG
jgi:lauroyl/myristoyl acyltransferase